MSQNAEKIAFALVAFGTVGLLVNEFTFSWRRIATLVFAALTLVGFLTSGIARWGKPRETAGRVV